MGKGDLGAGVDHRKKKRKNLELWKIETCEEIIVLPGFCFWCGLRKPWSRCISCSRRGDEPVISGLRSPRHLFFFLSFVGRGPRRKVAERWRAHVRTLLFLIGHTDRLVSVGSAEGRRGVNDRESAAFLCGMLSM